MDNYPACPLNAMLREPEMHPRIPSGALRQSPADASSIRMLRGTKTVAEAVGNTPLIRLNQLTRDLPENVEVYAKAEWMNREVQSKTELHAALFRMPLKLAELQAGGVLLDASSGNTGIAYAMLAPAMGFSLKLCLPSNANEERKKTLRAYGAELILTDPALSSDGAIIKARELAEANPDWFYADQYNNNSNWQAHYQTTGPEIVEQTGGARSPTSSRVSEPPEPALERADT